MTTKRRLRATVSGRVQGVGYRFFTQELAASKQLVGFVENQSDRTVLVEVQGSECDLDAFLQVLRQGVGLARVDNIHVEWVAYQAECKGFEIKF